MGGRKLGDYPLTLCAFYRRFHDDDACLHYLVETRWPDGFRCPKCGGSDAGRLATRRVWVCRSCRHHTSATAGTVLHRTRLPLTTWFAAAYLVASLKPGISALLAAAMSTLASDLNCLSAVAVEDYYRRIGPHSTDKERLAVGKRVVLFCGLVSLLIAACFVSAGEKSILWNLGD